MIQFLFDFQKLVSLKSKNKQLQAVNKTPAKNQSMQPKDSEISIEDNSDDMKIQQSSIEQSQKQHHIMPSSSSMHGISGNVTHPSGESFERYKQFFGANFDCQEQLSSTFIDKLIEGNSSLRRCQNFVKDIQIDFVQTDIESTLVQISWGYFKISVYTLRLNLEFEDLHSGDEVFNEGSFGKVYPLFHDGKRYVVKSIELENRSNDMKDHDYLMLAYSEFFLNKVAGELGVSPKVHKIFGYDLIIYQKNAAFVQEQCLQILKICNSKQKYQKIHNQLRQNLRLLHLLQICHCDIKPQNVVWSRERKKALFIDFGLSKVLKQKLGFMSYVSFFGTFQFCSLQMKKLYYIKEKRYIDLYYNDVAGLIFTLKRYQLQSKSFEKFGLIKFENERQLFVDKSTNDMTWKANSYNFNNLVNVFKIKHLLFIKQYELVLQYMARQPVFKMTVYKIFVQQFIVKQKKLDSHLVQKIKEYQKILKNGVDEVQSQESVLVDYFSMLYDEGIQNVFSMAFNVQVILSRNSLAALKGILDNFQVMKYLLEFFYQNLGLAQQQKKQQQCSQLIEKLYLLKNSATLSKFQIQQTKTSPFTKLNKMRDILNYFLEYFYKKQDKECLETVRVILIRVDEYKLCQNVENIIVNMRENRIGYQFYLIRILYCLEHSMWGTTLFFYPNEQWIKEVKQRVVLASDQHEFVLKQCTLLILGGVTHEKIDNYLVACFKVEQLEQTDTFVSQLRLSIRKKLAQIIAYLQKIAYGIMKKQIPTKPRQKSDGLSPNINNDIFNFIHITNKSRITSNKAEPQRILGIPRYFLRISTLADTSIATGSDTKPAIEKQLSYSYHHTYGDNARMYVQYLQFLLMMITLNTDMNVNTALLKEYLQKRKQQLAVLEGGVEGTEILCMLFVFNRFQKNFLCRKASIRGIKKEHQIKIQAKKLQQFEDVMHDFSQLLSQPNTNQALTQLHIHKNYKYITQILISYCRFGIQKSIDTILQSLTPDYISTMMMKQNAPMGISEIINTVRYVVALADYRMEELYEVLYTMMSLFLRDQEDRVLLNYPGMLLALVKLKLKKQQPLQIFSYVSQLSVKSFQTLSQIDQTQTSPLSLLQLSFATQFEYEQVLYVIAKILCSKATFKQLIQFRDQCLKFAMSDILTHPQRVIFIGMVSGFVYHYSKKNQNQCNSGLKSLQNEQIKRRIAILLSIGLASLKCNIIVCQIHIFINILMSSVKISGRKRVITMRNFLKFYIQKQLEPRDNARVIDMINKRKRNSRSKRKQKDYIFDLILLKMRKMRKMVTGLAKQQIINSN